MSQADISWFEDILQTTMPGVKVVSVRQESATNPGESYASEILRLHITLICRKENSQGSVINGSATLENLSKTISKTFILKKKLADEYWSYLQSFPREVKMLTTILPVIESLLQKAGYSNDEWTIGPRFIGNSRDYNEIILEDLKANGYECVDKFNGWSLGEAEMTIRALARIHAASFIACSLDLLHHDDLERYCFTRDMNFLYDIYAGGFTFLAGIMKKYWGKDWLSVSEWLESESINLGKTLMKLREEDPPHLTVLNHGDLWINNVMIKFVDASPSSLRFIDFQISHFGSIGWDLNFYFHCDITGKLKHEYYDKLLHAYCNSFDDCLKRLNSRKEGPSVLTVKSEINRLELVGLLNVAGDLPMLFSPAEETISYSELTGYSESTLKTKERMYTRPEYESLVKRILEPIKLRLQDGF